ncbi:MAG: methylamine utilization protein MauG [Nitrospirales bacterium]|nr:MAG: methylamine utilization protein MauG [Nitrospirales bacterium]
MQKSMWSVGFLSFVVCFVVNDNLTEAQSNGVPVIAITQDLVDEHNQDQAKMELGRLLFFDKILSGNKNISCATCHHPLAGTGDGLSLPVGEGGRGLGVTRDVGQGSDTIHERIPRNAPPIFGLNTPEIHTLFHDGRVAVDTSQPSGFLSPAEDDLPHGLDNVVAAQAMFPVTSSAEMAGQTGENGIADAAALGHLTGPNGVWGLLAERIKAIPEYRQLFRDVFNISDVEISYVHAANAIAAFEIEAWKANDTPFDRALRGEWQAMSFKAIRGMQLFYGKARCYTCHSGTSFTDMKFYAIAMPQIGPGKGDGVDGHEDFGRERVTGDQGDRYRFRTPPLRNVALTAPYGHDGAFQTLEGIVRHHLNPILSLRRYQCSKHIVVPSHPTLNLLDCLVQNDPDQVALIAAANELQPVRLKKKQIGYLIEFLRALTDPTSLDLRLDVPMSVPSGIPVVE